MARFQATGWADSGMYTSKDGLTVISCNVYIDRDAQIFGDQLQVVGQKTIVTFLLSEVPTPQVGATLQIDAETWKLEKKISQDESKAKWTLNPYVS